MPSINNKYVNLNKLNYCKYVKNGILGNLVVSGNNNLFPSDIIDDVIHDDSINLHYKINLILPMKKTSGEILSHAFQCITSSGNGLVTSVDFPNLITIGMISLDSVFRHAKNLNTVKMDNLITIENSGFKSGLQDCTSLTTAPTFANLTTVGNYGLNYCFKGCTSLTTAPTFASLTTVGYAGLQYGLQDCTSLTTAPTFANVTTIGNNGLSSCFYGCTSLTTPPTFANLTSIGNGGLSQCFRNTKITSLSFPALASTSFGSYTNQFNNMLNGVTGCTVHFPSNLQSVIGSWSDVTNGFGGTNTTILWDLPATT